MEQFILISLYQVCVLTWFPGKELKLKKRNNLAPPTTVLKCNGKHIISLQDNHMAHFKGLKLNFMNAGFYNAENKDKKGRLY